MLYCENKSNRLYTSCIKINGVPILPPLVVPENLTEYQKYKQQAVDIEQKLAYSKLRQLIPPEITLQNYDEPPQTSLEHQLIYTQPEPTETLEVPSENQNLSLTVEIVDVVEYRDNCIKEFHHYHSGNIRSDTTSYIEDQKNIESLPSSPKREPTPRLIRSNSYTLETPSPALAAHLEKLKESEDEQKSYGLQSTVSQQTWSFLDHSVDTSEFEDIERNKRSTDVYCNLDAEGLVDGKSLVRSNELKLLKLLNEVPMEFTDRIIALLESKNFSKLNGLVMAETSERVSEVPSVEDNQKNQNYSCNEIEAKIESKLLEKNAIESNLIDIKNDCDIDSKVCCKGRNQIIGCNRKLFSESNQINSDVKEKAASVIGAFAKGYLTRRLYQTEKVQRLIKTIKDTVLCAVELHRESMDTISEADIELHRRLLQQVTAACYEFHDVFFGLSIVEQMGIIALDRQRQREKAKKSAGSSLSSRASSKRSNSRVTTKMF